MRVFRRSTGSLFLILLLACFIAAPGSSLAKPPSSGPGNSANAKACQHGGWMSLQAIGSGPFTNQGDCVSYAAGGGTLIPLNPIATLTLNDHDDGNCILGLSGTGLPAGGTFEAWFTYGEIEQSPGEFLVGPDGSFIYSLGIGLQPGTSITAIIRTLDGAFIAQSNALSCE